MAIREIEYTVSASGIVPAVEQFGGTQREHKPTRLVFRLSDELKEKVSEYTASGTVVYRFDAYDGEGNRLSFGPFDWSEETDEIEFYLERWQTEHGGRIRVYLVISAIISGETETEKKTEMELYSFPAQLRLNNLPDGSAADGENYESVSTLAAEARENAEIAVECRKAAEAAAEVTRPLWGDGTTFVFDGGTDEDGTGEADVNFAIDENLDCDSKNAVQNQEIFSAFSSLLNTEYTGDTARVDLFEALSKFQKATILAAHPVGSYYWSTDPTSPAELFGGTWEQVKNRFVLAAGDKYEVGNTGGSETITIGASNLPESIGIPYSDGTTGSEGGFDRSIIYTNCKVKNYANTKFSGANSEPIDTMPPYEVAYCWKRTE